MYTELRMGEAIPVLLQSAIYCAEDQDPFIF